MLQDYNLNENMLHQRRLDKQFFLDKMFLKKNILAKDNFLRLWNPYLRKSLRPLRLEISI